MDDFKRIKTNLPFFFWTAILFKQFNCGKFSRLSGFETFLNCIESFLFIKSRCLFGLRFCCETSGNRQVWLLERNKKKAEYLFRGDRAFWNEGEGWGAHLPLSHTHTPNRDFPKFSLRLSLSQTSLQSSQCLLVSNRFVTMH